jgi:hypothetical protein
MGESAVMVFPIEKVAQWIFSYKYLVLFPVMVVEGPIITVIAGFLVSLWRLNGLAAYAVLVAGLPATHRGGHAPVSRAQHVHPRARQLLGATHHGSASCEAVCGRFKVKHVEADQASV